MNIYCCEHFFLYSSIRWQCESCEIFSKGFPSTPPFSSTAREPSYGRIPQYENCRGIFRIYFPRGNNFTFNLNSFKYQMSHSLPFHSFNFANFYFVLRTERANRYISTDSWMFHYTNVQKNQHENSFLQKSEGYDFSAFITVSKSFEFFS